MLKKQFLLLLVLKTLVLKVLKEKKKFLTPEFWTCRFTKCDYCRKDVSKSHSVFIQWGIHQSVRFVSFYELNFSCYYFVVCVFLITFKSDGKLNINNPGKKWFILLWRLRFGSGGAPLMKSRTENTVIRCWCIHIIMGYVCHHKI